MPTLNPGSRLVHAYSKYEENQDSDSTVTIFNMIALLSVEERSEIAEAAKVVQAAQSSLHIARAVTTNLDDLLDLIVEIGEKFLSDPKALNDGLTDQLAKLSCKILNLCASFRSYLEHQETYLKKQLGRSSPDWAVWRGFLNELESENKYYSLIYGLRNYIQHVDMPPLNLKLHSTDPDEVTLALDLVVENLLTPTAQWSSDMRSFIKSHGARISLWDALKGWDEAFRIILEKCNEFRIRPAIPAAELILNVRSKYGVPDYGILGITVGNLERSDGNITLSVNWIEEKEAVFLVDLLGGNISSSTETTYSVQT